MNTGQFQLSRLENQSKEDLYFKNQNGEVNKVTISSNLQYIATFHATRERQVKIWDLKKQKLIKEENTSPYCTRLEVLEFSHNNAELYIMQYGYDALVIVHIMEDQKRFIELEERCQGFKVSQDKYYACQFLSGYVHFNIWDLRTENIVNSLNYQSDARIVACLFLKNSKIITLSTYEEDYKLFQLWDLKKNQIIKSKRDVFISCYPELFVHDDIMIVHYTADEMSFIEMWNLSTFTKIRKIYQQLFGFFNLHIFDYHVIGSYNENCQIEDPFNFERFVRYDQGMNDNEIEDENDIEEELEEDMNNLPQIHQNQDIKDSDNQEIQNEIDEENQNESNQNSNSDIQNIQNNAENNELINEEELNEDSSQKSEDEKQFKKRFYENQQDEEISEEQLQSNNHHQGIDEENDIKSHLSMSQSNQDLDDDVQNFKYGCLNIITMKERIRRSKFLKQFDKIIFFEQGFLYHDNIEKNFYISFNVGQKQ